MVGSRGLLLLIGGSFIAGSCEEALSLVTAATGMVLGECIPTCWVAMLPGSD